VEGDDKARGSGLLGKPLPVFGNGRRKHEHFNRSAQSRVFDTPSCRQAMLQVVVETQEKGYSPNLVDNHNSCEDTA
jgi:hypothetical protein